jgi:hypothetical protein
MMMDSQPQCVTLVSLVNEYGTGTGSGSDDVLRCVVDVYAQTSIRIILQVVYIILWSWCKCCDRLYRYFVCTSSYIPSCMYYCCWLMLVGFVCELLELSGGFDCFCSLYDFLVVCMIAYSQ